MTGSQDAQDGLAVQGIQLVARVEQALRAELHQRSAEVVAADARLALDAQRLIDFAGQGGKRLRAQFLLWGYLAAAGGGARPPADVPEPVVRAAAAVELLQACALLHDDVIDRSETRRGALSVHRAVAKHHADQLFSGDAEHYGMSVAVLLGDLALAWADDVLVAAAAELGRLAEVLPAWRSIRSEVLAGQLLDLRVTADPAAAPASARRDAWQVNRFKTAAYTVERPLEIGSRLGGASDSTVTALRRYGAAIGLAFQLRDDLLGVFGDPQVTGKPAGDDVIEGKRTVLLADTQAALPPPELARLQALLAEVRTPEQVDEVRQLILASGAVQRSEDEVTALVERARAALDGVLPAAARAALEALADLATQRSR